MIEGGLVAIKVLGIAALCVVVTVILYCSSKRCQKKHKKSIEPTPRQNGNYIDQSVYRSDALDEEDGSNSNPTGITEPEDECVEPTVMGTLPTASLDNSLPCTQNDLVEPFSGAFTAYKNEATGSVIPIPSIAEYLVTPTASLDLASEDQSTSIDTPPSIANRKKKGDDIHIAQVHYNSYRQKSTQLLDKLAHQHACEDDSPTTRDEWSSLKIPPIKVTNSSESDSDSLKLRIQSIERYSRQSLQDEDDELSSET